MIASDHDDVGAHSQHLKEPAQVRWVRGQERHGRTASGSSHCERHGGIDDIGGACVPAQQAGGTGTRALEGDFAARLERLGKKRLASTIPPRLRNNTCGHHDRVADRSSDTEHCPHVSIVAIERNERPSIKNEHYEPYNRVRAVRNSSSVNAPWTRSHSDTTSPRPRATR
jgi:hypothetical protein